jgi:methionine-rich copper-binding protein CopC
LASRFSAAPRCPRDRRWATDMRAVGFIGATAALVLVGGVAGAHAFLDEAEPRVGSTVRTAPHEVTLRFPQDLEPAFSVPRSPTPPGSGRRRQAQRQRQRRAGATRESALGGTVTAGAVGRYARHRRRSPSASTGHGATVAHERDGPLEREYRGAVRR